MTTQEISELQQHAAQWDKLAETESHDETGRNRAAMYRKTAESFRVEIRNGGTPVCACCLKPYPKPGRY